MSLDPRLLLKSDDRAAFSCGQADVDRFFREHAGQNQFRHHICATWVIAESSPIAFVTVAPGVLEQGLLRGRLPPYDIPVLRLARMGVATEHQDRKLGAGLLRHVFRLALDLATNFGCVGVHVDAKPAAVGFYERYGFRRLHVLVPVNDQPVPMFIPTSQIRAALLP